MIHLFEEMKPAFINKLVELKRYYLVSQTYKGVTDRTSTEPCTPLLITDYADPGLAQGHLNALKGDRFAALINLTKEPHQAKVREMLSEESIYRLFWAVIKSKKELQRRLHKNYDARMRRYIARNTNWTPAADATVDADLQLIYGDLFIILKFGQQRRRLSFEELEKA